MTQPPVENLGERIRTEETMEMGEAGNGAPVHVMPESCQYWDHVNDLFYISLGVGVWQLIGVPPRIIAMWSGVIVDIPAGWALCDGTLGTPDLRDRFIVGAGAAYAVGAAGGAATNDLTHTHASGTLAADNDTHNHNLSITTYANPGAGVTVFTTATGTDNDTHSHTVSGDTAVAGSAVQENRPPYYALALIMRL